MSDPLSPASVDVRPLEVGNGLDIDRNCVPREAAQ